MRLMMWLGLAVLVYLAIRKHIRANKPPSNPTQADTPEWSDDSSGSAAPPMRGANQGAGKSETMLSCAHCQVYFPASEVVTRGTQDYCSVEHADLGSKTS